MENTAKVKGILRSVGTVAKENVNGTLFRTVTVEIDKVVYFAKMWEKSYQNGFELGKEYTVELILDKDDVWMTVLTGSDAKVATAKDFAHLFATVK